MGWLQLGVEVENQQGICDGSVHDIPTRQFDGLHWDQKITTSETKDPHKAGAVK